MHSGVSTACRENTISLQLAEQLGATPCSQSFLNIDQSEAWDEPQWNKATFYRKKIHSFISFHHTLWPHYRRDRRSVWERSLVQICLFSEGGCSDRMRHWSPPPPLHRKHPRWSLRFRSITRRLLWNPASVLHIKVTSTNPHLRLLISLSSTVHLSFREMTGTTPALLFNWKRIIKTRLYNLYPRKYTNLINLLYCRCWVITLPTETRADL